jgi:hypothetical protein
MEEPDDFEALSGVREGIPPELEDTPLGTSETQPEGEGEPRRGPEAMPGIPTDGDPPSGG